MIALRRNISKYQSKKPDLEEIVAKEISKTGKEQIKRRKKAGLSVFYLKDGKIIEVMPDKTIVEVRNVPDKWVTLEKSKRKLILK